MGEIKSVFFCFGFFLLTAGNVCSASAEDAPSIKTYTLKDLRPVVSNSGRCDAIHQELKALTQTPLSLQFSKHPEKEGHYLVSDMTGRLKEHTHTRAKQKAEGNRFHRTSTGSFEVNGQKVDYVADISADLDNPGHQYLYPVILAGDNARCYYTALIQPSEETVAAFKESVRSGAAAQGADLHQA